MRIRTIPFAMTRLVALLLGIFAGSPLATGQKVKVDIDPEADFSKIRTYQWRTHPVFEKRPELQEVYATGIQIVLEAGNTELIKRGLPPADSDPDAYVTFFLVAQDAQKTTTTIDPASWWGSGYGWYSPPIWTTTQTEYYKAGMLVLDIIDARTSKLVWRAYCGDKIRDMRKRDKNINSAVRKAIEKFPSKP